MSKIKSPLKQNEDVELVKLSDADAQSLFNETFDFDESILENEVEEEEEEEKKLTEKEQKQVDEYGYVLPDITEVVKSDDDLEVKTKDDKKIVYNTNEEKKRLKEIGGIVAEQMQPYIDSGEYSEEELNTIRKYLNRLETDLYDKKQPLDFLPLVVTPREAMEDALDEMYYKFGEMNVIKISEQLNLSPEFLDIFKSENTDIYRVEDTRGELQPKLIRIKENGEVEFITSKELKDVDPNFYLKLNDDLEDRYYEDLDNLGNNIVDLFDKMVEETGTAGVVSGLDEDQMLDLLRRELKKYNIDVRQPAILGDYVTLVSGKDPSKELRINLNTNYLESSFFGTAPGPLNVRGVRNSGEKIFNSIENFVKEHGKQPEVIDHEENIIEKNIKAANKLKEERDNSLAVEYNTIKEIDKKIKNAETQLEFYNREQSEESKEQWLENHGQPTDLINVKDYADRNNISGDFNENEFITQLELQTRKDLRYGLNEDEWRVYSGRNRTQEQKDLFVKIDNAIERLKKDEKNFSFWQNLGGLEDVEYDEDKDLVLQGDLAVALFDLLEDKPQDEIEKILLSFTKKEALLREAKAIVLDNYYTEKQVEIDINNKNKNDFEVRKIELENDIEDFNQSVSTFEEKIAPITQSINNSIKKVNDIDAKIETLIEDAEDIKEKAKTDSDYRDVYTDLYKDYQELLAKRQKLVNQYEIDNKEYNNLINSEEYKEIANSNIDLNNRQISLGEQIEVLNKAGNKLSEEFKTLYDEIGFNAADGVFEDSYESVTQYKKWKNAFADNPTMDAIGAFNEQFTDQVLKVFAIIPEAAVWQANRIYGNDPNEYSQWDAMSDIVANYIEEDKFSAYTDRDGRIAEAGWTYRNITRTMADMLPFTLGIIHAGRKGDARGIKNAYKKFTGGTLDDMAMKWNITKRTYSLTIYDNYQEAKKLGLNDMQALEYATFMSSATAMSQLIMPDNLFLKGGAGTNPFKSSFAKSLSGTTNMVAAREISKNTFKNLVKELGEEEIELLFDDLNKMSFLANHESMFLDAEAHADLAMGTIILSGGIQQIGNRQTYKAVKERVRAEFKYRGLETLHILQKEKNGLNSKIARLEKLENPNLDKIEELKKRVEEIDAAIVYGQAELEAINNAPSYASSEHIDLIRRKNELIKKKSSAKGEELNEINKEIKDISAELESTNAYENFQNKQEKDVERSEEIAKEEFGEDLEVYETDSRQESSDVVKSKMQEQSKRLEEEINDIKQDENGNAVNLQEQPALSKLKNEKSRVDNELANMASTEERQKQERELILIQDKLNKIDPSKKLTRRAELQQQLKRLDKLRRDGQISGLDFLAETKKIKDAIKELSSEIKSDKSVTSANESVVDDLVEKYLGLANEIDKDQAYSGYKENAFITPPDASGRRSIIINKKGVLQSGYINAGQHEILHAILKETLKSDPELQRALADAMMEFANDNPGKIKIGPEFDLRMRAYNESDQKYEEYLTVMAEALVRGDVKFSNNFKGKVSDMMRRFNQKYRRPDIEFETGEDVINFLRDYNRFFKKRKKNPAFSKMIKQGAKGKLLERKEKREKEVRYGPGFSKSLRFQFSKNPDLKDDFDNLTQNPDGTKRWNSKVEFQNSSEYWEGLTQILTNPQLESLIKEGIGGETGIQYAELDDFVEKVKVKLQRRYEGQTRVIKDADGNPIVDERGIERRERVLDENGNPKGGFDPSMANGSLFGWLIGGSGSYTNSNLYRARGDVMNEYKEEIETISADTEGTARKLSQIPSDNDVKQETKNEVERNKIDLLKLPVIERVSDKIKSKVKPAKGDGHKEIISKHAGEVGQLIFDIPGDKIVKGGANLTAVTKYEEGMPIPGEAQNIQRVFNAPQFAEKFIKTLPLYNVVERTGDINLKGENLDVSRNVFGVAIGLKGLPMDYFYEDYIDPRSLSKDPLIKAESITSPKGRSKGLTTQTQVKKLKQEFINPTPETIEKFKRDIGITPKLEANEYSRDIGQLQKGVAKVISMNVSLSAAQRNLQDQLNKAIKEGKSPKVTQEIKQQTANITGAQSKIAFSKGVADQKNRLQFSESIPVEQLSNAEILAQNKDYKLIVKRGKQIPINMNTPKGRLIFKEWVIKDLSKRLPKAFFYTSGTFDGTSKGLFTEGDYVGAFRGPKANLLNVSVEETIAMFAPDHVFGPDDADISMALTRVTQNKKNLEDTNAKLQRAIGFKKILNVLNQMIQEDKANIPYVAALLSSTSSNMNHFMRKGSIYEFRNTLNEANVEEHTQAASDFAKFVLNRMVDGTFDKYIDVAMQAYFQGSLPLKFEILLVDPAGEFNYKNNAGIYTKLILVDGKPVWIRYFNPDVNNNQGGINPNVLILAGGNTIAQEYGVGVDESLYNHDEVVSKQQELLFKIFNGDITQEVASKTINEYAMKFSKVSPSSEVKKAIKFSKAIENARLINHNTPSRGMSAWDFDDTLATTKSGVRATVPNPDGTPQPNRKVIFLAGGAGSGKSNVVKKLGLEEQGFKIVNSDISLEWLKKNSGLPENMNDLTREQLSELGRLQAQARKISKGKMMKYQGNADGVVVDGTGGSIKAMQKLVNEFKEKGYDVSMVFVETSLETALDRNRKRKERSLLDKIVIRNHEAVQGNKEGFKEMFGERFMEVKTDNLTQADPMPADLMQQMNDFVSSYKKLRLDAEQFATQGADILEQGGVFDFSEFNVVTEGAQGPMFKTAFDRAQKYGTKDTYVLTARPAESAGPIQQFLASQGLNIPLENITGLGNSTGEAKAEWILEKFSEGYNDIYFADDAMQNVEAVKDVLDQLDIKSEVVQAKIQFSRGIDNKVDKMFTNPALVKIKENISINNVSNVSSLTRDGVYSNIQFSKKHRGEYENLISKNRPDLVKEGLVSQTVDQMFDLVNNLSIPPDKRRKYEKIMTKWLATSTMKLPEDNYKLQDAVELAEKNKLDVFSYRNPNEIIEKFAGKSKAKPINPDTVELFVKDESKTNKKYGITEYVVEETKESQAIVRKVVDTHWGPKSNPWCICARDKNGSMDAAWDNWKKYSDGPKRIVFQNGKLLAFYANDLYWDRMDNDTDAPVINIKEGRVTKKVELVPIGKNKVDEFVIEVRTVSEDGNTVTTEIVGETGSNYEVGTKIVENRVNGVTVKKTRSTSDRMSIEWGFEPGRVQEVQNYNEKGELTSSIFYQEAGVIGTINHAEEFGGITESEIVEKKGDIISNEGGGEYFAQINLAKQGIKNADPTVITEIGWEMDGKLEDVITTSSNGETRVDLKKILKIDSKAQGLPPGIQFSKDISKEFNELLERTTGVEARKRFSEAQAKIRGKKGRYKGIIPASAQDFLGLLYNFMGKGKQGDADMAFFKKALIDPFARGIDELNASRQAASNDYKNLTKEFPKVKKRLNKKAGDTGFTNDQAVRVYLWIKAGFEVPGLSNRDLAALNAHVKNDPELQAFADALGIISKKAEGYAKPGEYWLVENIISDLTSDGAIGEVRAEFLAEWQQNVDQIFSEQNLNKIEAIYGSKFREALEDILYRMQTGRNRSQGGGRLMNNYMNWVNNSVGAIMFFNIRSAVLQTISATNYINWSDNNPLKAAMAFANQKQFWSDFVMLFNSDYLKQRRAGNRRGVNEAELTSAVMGVGPAEQAKAALRYLLKIGFLPTQIADSFAIASGGASFYRNRVNSYLKQGMSKAEAEQKAFLDFQETTEVSQQSARPDMISQQQANPLGRLILSFQNTPMQYARIMNKAARDIANGRGDFKTHVSKIIYYGAIQSIIFSALQSAIFASLGDDEEEDFDTKKQRILNQMIDSVLSGIGYGGKAISTVKNATMEYLKQRDKGFRADHAYTILQLLGFSPPIGSKLRKIYSAIQTEKFNKDVFKRRGLTLDNPIWQAIGYTIEGFFNVPLGRLSQKMQNLDNALDSNNEWWERIALIMGWNTWDLGIKDADIEGIKEEIKEEKKEKDKERREQKKKEKEEEKKKEQEELIKQNQEKSKEDGICSAISRSGNRCKNKAESGGLCTIHAKVEQGTKEVQCSKIKSNGERCKMKTKAKSGLCYYHD